MQPGVGKGSATGLGCSITAIQFSDLVVLEVLLVEKDAV